MSFLLKAEQRLLLLGVCRRNLLKGGTNAQRFYIRTNVKKQKDFKEI